MNVLTKYSAPHRNTLIPPNVVACAPMKASSAHLASTLTVNSVSASVNIDPRVNLDRYLTTNRANASVLTSHLAQKGNTSMTTYASVNALTLILCAQRVKFSMTTRVHVRALLTGPAAHMGKLTIL